MNAKIEVGDTVTCAVTGKTFTVERQGCTFNYARNADGLPVSDEGVDIFERNQLLDRSKPFGCYLSSDGTKATGWKGNVLGHVVNSHAVKLTSWSFTHGSKMLAVTVRDIHGGLWYGRGSPGVHINLRAYK